MSQIIGFFALVQQWRLWANFEGNEKIIAFQHNKDFVTLKVVHTIPKLARFS